MQWSDMRIIPKLFAGSVVQLPILNGENIQIHFPKTKNFLGRTKSWVKAVDGINITARKGQTVGVVGESGSGKTTLGLGLLRLLDAQGRIVFKDQDISRWNRRQIKGQNSYSISY